MDGHGRTGTNTDAAAHRPFDKLRAGEFRGGGAPVLLRALHSSAGAMAGSTLSTKSMQSTSSISSSASLTKSNKADCQAFILSLHACLRKVGSCLFNLQPWLGNTSHWNARKRVKRASAPLVTCRRATKRSSRAASKRRSTTRIFAATRCTVKSRTSSLS